MKTNVNVHLTVELADHRRVESLDNGGWLDNAARVSATCTLGSAQEEQVLNKGNTESIKPSPLALLIKVGFALT